MAPHFVDDTAASGVDHRYDGGSQFFEGGGVAVFDCDDDGRPDLYLAGGTRPAGLYRNGSAVGGALRFTRVASAVTDLIDVTGAYPIDIDSDGHIDLVVLRVGGNVILRGLGNCVFERANDALGIDGGHAWTDAFSATWEGANALPTLVFGNYSRAGRAIVRRQPASPARARRTRVRRAGGAGAGLLHAVGPVQRLAAHGSARPSHEQRPELLPRR